MTHREPLYWALLVLLVLALPVLAATLSITLISMPGTAFSGTAVSITVHVTAADGQGDKFIDSNFSVTDQNSNNYSLSSFSNDGAGQYSFNITAPNVNDAVVFTIQVSETIDENTTSTDWVQKTVEVSTHKFSVGFILDQNYPNYKIYVPAIITSGTFSTQGSQSSTGPTDIDYLAGYKDDNIFAIVSVSDAFDLNIFSPDSDLNAYLSQTQVADRNQAFYITFTKGDFTYIDLRMAEVRSGKFLDRKLPAFGYNDADKFTVVVGSDYRTGTDPSGRRATDALIDLNGDLFLPDGKYSLIIENKGAVGDKTLINVRLKK